MPQKLFGYAQVPRQACQPYQNEQGYQRLIKRHLDKGNSLSQFEFPKKQGEAYKNNAEKTRAILAKFARSEAN